MISPAAATAAGSLGISLVTFRPDMTLLQRTLASLRTALATLQQHRPTQALLTIIDNGGDARRITQLVQQMQLDAMTHVVANPHNVGFGAANNQAIRGSRAELHLILNPDVELAPDALAIAIPYLEQHKDVAALTPLCCNGNGAREYLCKQYPAVLDLFLRGFAPRWLARRFTPRLQTYECQALTNGGTAADVPLISGCFMLCRTAALQQVGGFDERYFLYFEDFALSLALRNTGKLRFLPQCRIVHHGGKAARKGMRHIRYFMRSAWRFYQQHGWRWW
jgi:GT2 family glycosyltransferase